MEQEIKKITDPDENPVIEVIGDKLVISISKDDLIFAINNNPSGYNVVEPDKLLEAFANKLAHYQSSNAKELGYNELQLLFDTITEEVCTDGYDIIESIDPT